MIGGLDKYDRSILKYLLHNPPATTNRIAERVDMSWTTVDRHLKELGKKGFVIKRNKKWALQEEV